jgi:hypothetical protein
MQSGRARQRAATVNQTAMGANPAFRPDVAFHEGVGGLFIVEMGLVEDAHGFTCSDETTLHYVPRYVKYNIAKHWETAFFSTSQENRRGILELRELATMFLQVSTCREGEFPGESFARM